MRFVKSFKITEQRNDSRTVIFPPPSPQQASPACTEGDSGQPDDASPGDGGQDCPHVLQDRRALVLLSVGHTRPWSSGNLPTTSVLQKWKKILRDVQDLECAIQYDQPERICSENNQTKLIGEREACSVEFVVDIYNCNQKNFKSISNN